MTTSDKPDGKLKLIRQERVTAAWAEHARGSGWSNRPLWVCVWDGAKHRLECIQPEDQTEEMKILYDTCAVSVSAMTEAVRRKVHDDNK